MPGNGVEFGDLVLGVEVFSGWDSPLDVGTLPRLLYQISSRNATVFYEEFSRVLCYTGSRAPSGEICVSLGLCLARHYQPGGQHKIPPHRGEVPRHRRRKELGIRVESEWWIDEEGIAFVVDLALPVDDGWIPVTFGDGPAQVAAYASRTRPNPMLTCRKYMPACAPLETDWLKTGDLKDETDVTCR